MNRDELLELIPAYALDALNEEERIELEAFLKEDAEAQALLADYQAMTSAFVFDVPERSAPVHLGADLANRLKARQQSSIAEETKSADVPTKSQSSILAFPGVTVFAGIAATMLLLVGFVYLVSSGIINLDSDLEQQLSLIVFMMYLFCDDLIY